MKNIYGTIGYTVLKNISTNNKIIILADMHDTLPSCTNQTNISDWFKSKFKSSKILLEEVPREGFKLEELWPQSPHTQELKKLFKPELRTNQLKEMARHLKLVKKFLNLDLYAQKNK